MSANHPTEDCHFELIHEHEQQMEDIEAYLGVLHNSFREVNDHLNDLDTGCCWCQDVLLSPVLDKPLVSLFISTVGGCKEVVPLMMTVDKNEVPLLLQVHGQRAWRSWLFHVNMPSDCGGLVRHQSHGGAEREQGHCGQVGDARTT